MRLDLGGRTVSRRLRAERGATPTDSSSTGELNEMDTGLSTSQVANALYVSMPTVRRAVGDLGLEPATTPGGHLRLDEVEVSALRDHLGLVPPVDGLSRTEVQALAALSRAPLGLRSVRAVARAARISPTAAGRALEALTAAGLVCSEERTLAEGRATAATTWTVAPGPTWFGVADQIALVELPRPSPATPPRRVPQRFWHLFWNADPAALDLDHDAPMIATRMLLGDDLSALAWACAHLPGDALRHAAANRGADPRLRALVDTVMAAA
jgi:DNA-binding transcriptional ArsR family regulator